MLYCKHPVLTGVLSMSAFLFTGLAQATPVTGSANIAGNLTLSLNSASFQPTFTTTTGAMETGDFAGLTGGTIQSLTMTTGAVSVPGFVNFQSGLATPITFDLTSIAAGIGTVAGCTSMSMGVACTPAGSPLTLFQLSSNTVIISLQVNGLSYTGSAASGSSPTSGIFSTQTAMNGTVAQIYGLLTNGGTLTGITYSASFAPTAVPEPTPLLLLGLGLLGVGSIARWRRSTK